MGIVKKMLPAKVSPVTNRRLFVNLGRSCIYSLTVTEWFTGQWLSKTSGNALKSLLVISIGLLALLIQGCDFSSDFDLSKRDLSKRDSPPLKTVHGATMGTSYQVKWVSSVMKRTEAEVQSKLDAVLEQVNQQMSTYRPDSELSILNQDETGAWHAVSADLTRVLRRSIELHSLTRGAFDVSIGPLVNLWGFGPEPDPDRVPADAALEQAKHHTGVQAIEFSSQGVRYSSPRYVDLSAIAKGYAVDKVAELLSKLGIEHFLVEIGGELYAKGEKTPDRPWRIAIETPSLGKRDIHQVLEIRNKGVATSGDYRNFRMIQGKRYSHSLDPRTGRPITHRLASVTVLDETTTRADALATAIMVMGEKEGLDFANAEDLAVLMIVRLPTGFVTKSTKAFQALMP